MQPKRKSTLIAYQHINKCENKITIYDSTKITLNVLLNNLISLPSNKLNIDMAEIDVLTYLPQIKTVCTLDCNTTKSIKTCVCEVCNILCKFERIYHCIDHNTYFCDWCFGREKLLTVINENQNDFSAYVNLGFIFQRHYHDYRNAKKYFLRALEISPERGDLHFNIGMLLKDHLNDPVNAIIHFDKALEFTPNCLEYEHDKIMIYLNIAILLDAHFNDYKGARNYYQKIIEYFPHSRECYIVHQKLGFLLMKHFSDYDGAKMHYEQAIKTSILSRNIILCDYGDLLKNHFGDYDNAKKHYMLGLELYPRDSKVHNNLGHLYMIHLGDIKSAEKCFVEALKLTPKYASAHVNIGFLYGKYYGNVESAKIHFKRALNIDQNVFDEIGYELHKQFVIEIGIVIKTIKS